MQNMKFGMITQEDKWPLVSVIILNYNGEMFLKSCLKSVLDTNYPNFKVLLVDNASTDGSVKLVRKLFADNPRLKIIINHENFGFAAGNNIAVKHAKGKFFVFLNNDTEVDPLWIKELVSVVLSDPLTGICGCKVMSINGENVESIGAFVDRYGDFYPRGRGANSVFYKSTTRVFVAHGVAFLIRRKVWEEVEGFDSKFFAGIEDLDLCWRVQLLGYKVLVNPNAVVYHVGEASRAKIKLHRRRFIAVRNMLRTLLKNYTISTLAEVLPKYFALTCAELLFLSFLKKGARIAMAYIEALLWNIRIFKETWVLHEKIQQSRLVNDKIIQAKMMKGSAKIAYFLYKRGGLTSMLNSYVR